MSRPWNTYRAKNNYVIQNQLNSSSKIANTEQMTMAMNTNSKRPTSRNTSYHRSYQQPSQQPLFSEPTSSHQDNIDSTLAANHPSLFHPLQSQSLLLPETETAGHLHSQTQLSPENKTDRRSSFNISSNMFRLSNLTQQSNDDIPFGQYNEQSFMNFDNNHTDNLQDLNDQQYGNISEHAPTNGMG